MLKNALLQTHLATVTIPNFGTVSKRAFKIIVPFQNAYLCEAGFSSTMTMKQNID